MEAKPESKKPEESSQIGANATWYVRSFFNSRKKTSTPCDRWGHASTLKDNFLYIQGGNGNKSKTLYWESPYRLDTSTWEWLKIEPITEGEKSFRDSHTLTFCNNFLYLFGGNFEKSSSNDLLALNLSTNAWEPRKYTEASRIPTPREGHSACLFRDKYLVIFGGWNGKESLNDCYVLDLTNTQVVGMLLEAKGTVPSQRESHSCCVIRDTLYIFGGQGNPVEEENGENMDLFHNDLYRLKITFDKNKAAGVWEKVESKGKIPEPRSSFGCDVYKDRYMFVVGGEGYAPLDKPVSAPAGKRSQEKSDDSQCNPKNDVWVYDVEINQWASLNVKNNWEFLPTFAHTCNIYKDCIIIFGGMNENSEPVGDVCVLSIDGSDPFGPNKVGSKPRREQKSITQEGGEKEKPEKPSINKVSKPKPDFKAIAPTHHGAGLAEPTVKEVNAQGFTELEGPMVSVSFLHSLSNLISWPLAAFGLLLDNCVINKASHMKVNVLNLKRMAVEQESKKGGKDSGESEMTYFMVEDDGKGWKHNDFINIFMKYDTDIDTNTALMEEEENPQEEERRKKLNEYAFNLKIAGFRLGKTLIYISKTEEEISLGFMSVDKRYNPDIHDNHVFLYSWKRGTEEYLTSQARKNKDIIMNALNGIFTEEDLLEDIDKVSNRLFILDLTPVAVSKKAANAKNQDYELKFAKKGGKVNDILVRTLDESLKNLYTDQEKTVIELSLRTYLSHFFLEPTVANIEISINDNVIPLVDVKKVVKDASSLMEINEPKFYQAFIITNEPEKEVKEQSKEGNSGSKRRTRQQVATEKKEFNQGVLIYYENRLIRRLENPKLGNLDFFSLQSRNLSLGGVVPVSLFDANGYIDVGWFLKPNMFKTEIDNPYYSNFLYSNFVEKLEGVGSLNQKRAAKGDIEEFDNVTKKVKATPSAT